MALTMNQKSVPAPAMIATSTSIAASVLGRDEAERGGDEREREQGLHAEHGPVARLPHPPGDHAQQAGHEQAAGERSGAIVVIPPAPSQPAITAIRLAAASSAATIAPTVTAVGRSPRRERLQRRARGLVLRAPARVAARLGLGAACAAIDSALGADSELRARRPEPRSLALRRRGRWRSLRRLRLCANLGLLERLAQRRGCGARVGRRRGSRAPPPPARRLLRSPRGRYRGRCRRSRTRGARPRRAAAWRT